MPFARHPLRVLLAGLAVTGVLSIWISVANAGTSTEDGCAGAGFLVEHTGNGSTVRTVATPDGPGAVLAEIDDRVTAVGYSAPQGTLYALATRNSGPPATRGSLAVAIDSAGGLTELGALTLPPDSPLTGDQLATAASGTIADEHWLLGVAGHLLDVDIRPGNPTYLHAIRVVQLAPESHVDDWDYDDASGLLYGIETGGGVTNLVGIDPASGQVTAKRLPTAAGSAGGVDAVFLDAERVLWGFTGAGGLVRVPLADPDATVATPFGPGMNGGDGAGCGQGAPPPAATTSSPSTPIPPGLSSTPPTPTTSTVAPSPASPSMPASPTTGPAPGSSAATGSGTAAPTTRSAPASTTRSAPAPTTRPKEPQASAPLGSTSGGGDTSTDGGRQMRLSAADRDVTSAHGGSATVLLGWGIGAVIVLLAALVAVIVCSSSFV